MTRPTPRTPTLTDAYNRRLRHLDPRLGPATPLQPDAGDVLLVDEERLLAIQRRIEIPDDAPYALFVPAVQELLVVRSAHDPGRAGWERLLDVWLHEVGDGTPMVRVPARDTDAAAALSARGLFPATTTSLRFLDQRTTPSASAVRGATWADRPLLLELLELMHESNVAAGGASRLATQRALLGQYLDEALAGNGTRCWVAEEDSDVVGLLTASTPEASEWAAPSTSLHPISYLGFASVHPSARGRGLARELAAGAMHWARERGATAMLLDHASQSPSARSCWTSLGFEPLWHTWQATPR